MMQLKQLHVTAQCISVVQEGFTAAMHLPYGKFTPVPVMQTNQEKLESCYRALYMASTSGEMGFWTYNLDTK